MNTPLNCRPNREAALFRNILAKFSKEIGNSFACQQTVSRVFSTKMSYIQISVCKAW